MLTDAHNRLCRGADLVEVAPAYDTNGTSRLEHSWPASGIYLSDDHSGGDNPCRRRPRA